jgi:hypothetical protein
VSDSGVAVDTGSDTGVDAMADEGAPAVDSGAPVDDGGGPVDDSGAPAVDSGAPAVDSGAPAVDSGAPSWDPGSIPGLALWLDGTSGLASVAGGGLAWVDRSGNRNDAVSVGTPTVATNAIGGKPAVHLNGTTDYLVVQDSASLQFATDDFAIALVAAHTTSFNGPWAYGMLYSKQILSTPPYVGPAIVANSLESTGALFAQVANQSGSEIQTTEQDFNTGKPFMLVLRRTGGMTLSMRVNGADAASATGAGYSDDVSAIGFALHIGGTQKGQDVLGDIAEVIAIHGGLSSPDLTALEGYLSAKYGL